MREKSVKYLNLRPEDALPQIDHLSPFVAIVVIEDEVSQIWQWEVSRWLVLSSCRYVLAWGLDCSSWDDSVDEANLEAFDYEDIPEDKIVMTTLHEDEDLDEVFWFAKHRAAHPVVTLNTTLILHISTENKKDEMEAAFAQA